MKNDRHKVILNIIADNEIETQDELLDRLRAMGFNVTQATVSRDINELKLVKSQTQSGKLCYSKLTNPDLSDIQISDKLLPVFAHGFLSADYANNLVIVKTLPGLAQGVASTIDSLNVSCTLGTIAGDDTIMIVCRNEHFAASIVQLLENLAK